MSSSNETTPGPRDCADAGIAFGTWSATGPTLETVTDKGFVEDLKLEIAEPQSASVYSTPTASPDAGATWGNPELFYLGSGRSVAPPFPTYLAWERSGMIGAQHRQTRWRTQLRYQGPTSCLWPNTFSGRPRSRTISELLWCRRVGSGISVLTPSMLVIRVGLQMLLSGRPRTWTPPVRRSQKRA